MRVARCGLRPGVADADHRPAVELIVGNALVLHPGAVHQSVAIVPAEPFGAAQTTFGLGRLLAHDVARGFLKRIGSRVARPRTSAACPGTNATRSRRAKSVSTLLVPAPVADRKSVV